MAEDNDVLKGYNSKEEWFRQDSVAFEIRNICKRIIDAYNAYAREGGDIRVGLVSKTAKEELNQKLNLSFHELDEFDVTEGALVGHEPEFFYKSPRNMATYVGGQLLTLRHIPKVTDMERDSQVDALNLADRIANPDQIISQPDIMNMQLQASIIWTAERMLGFDQEDAEAKK